MISISNVVCREMCIVAKMDSTSATDIRTFLVRCSHFMIMASRRRQSREKVLVESPEWKRGNIGYIDDNDPVEVRHGRQYIRIHWENTSYRPSYIDSTYVKKMEDISKTKRTRCSPNEGRMSPEQRVSLQGLRKDRALGRRLFEESSSRRRRIVEGETFELSIDPFADKPPEETGQKRLAKAPPQHEVPAEETGRKRSDKPPRRQSQQAGEKRSTKRPPQEGVRLEAAEKISRMKSPILPETSTLAADQMSTKRPPQEIGVRLEATEKSSRKGPPNQRLKESQELREAEERLRNTPALVLQAAHPFGDEALEQTGQKRSGKAPSQHGVPAEETGQKRSDKPPPRQSQQAGEKRSTKRPPQEGIRLEAAEKSPRKKSPILQETSTLAAEQISTKQPPQEIGVRLEATEKSSRKGPPNERLKEALELREAEERLRNTPALVLQAAHPFGDEAPEQTGQKRSAKAPPQHRVPTEETGQKRSNKPPPRQSQQAGEKRSTKRPRQEGVRQEAAEKSSRKKSPILQETSTMAAEQISMKQPPQEIGVRLEAMEKSSRKKSSSQVQETSTQSSRRRRFITEEDDEMFSCNVDPFSAEFVNRFEAHGENEAAESEHSSQENCF